MVEPHALAAKILEFLHDEDKKRGHSHIPVATLYKTFASEASYEVIQQAIGFLVDRDFIAAFSYSLTAKGRRERGIHIARAQNKAAQ
jgi:hypothetical protein